MAVGAWSQYGNRAGQPPTRMCWCRGHHNLHGWSHLFRFFGVALSCQHRYALNKRVCVAPHDPLASNHTRLTLPTIQFVANVQPHTPTRGSRPHEARGTHRHARRPKHYDHKVRTYFRTHNSPLRCFSDEARLVACLSVFVVCVCWCVCLCGCLCVCVCLSVWYVVRMCVC